MNSEALAVRTPGSSWGERPCVTLSYLACGKTKYAVLAPSDHPARAVKARLPHVFLSAGMKLIKRGLTSTGAERVANRANAVALAVRRLS